MSLVLQMGNPSLDNPDDLEDLSRYKKRASEQVKEEKTVLDALVALYRQRLVINQNHLKALDELHSTITVSSDMHNPLYEVLVRPVTDSLRKDIEAYTQYVQKSEEDLVKITFSSGPIPEASQIGQDLDAVKPLYVEYSYSCVPASNLPPHSLFTYRLPDEDIKHRKIAAKLHTKQRTARIHFETTYPKLLSDHMEYMEQVRRLVWNDTTRRSEISTTMACNANAEKVLIDGFSTADAIAVSYQKMELEENRLEFRHASIVDPITRELEYYHFVILGRDIDPGCEEDLTGELLVACLEKYSSVAYPYELPQSFSWTRYWAIIRNMESSRSTNSIYDIVSGLSDASEVYWLICMIASSTRTDSPLLDLRDQQSAANLRENPWDRSALTDLMKDVNQSIKRILKACIIAYAITGVIDNLMHILLTGRDTLEPSLLDWPLESILDSWDCDAWCPLPENVVWRAKEVKDGPPLLRRMKRFPAKSGDIVFLEVDEEGNIMDTLENAELKIQTKEEQPSPSPSSSSSSFSFSIKKLRKLMS